MKTLYLDTYGIAELKKAHERIAGHGLQFDYVMLANALRKIDKSDVIKALWFGREIPPTLEDAFEEAGIEIENIDADGVHPTTVWAHILSSDPDPCILVVDQKGSLSKFVNWSGIPVVSLAIDEKFFHEYANANS